MSNDPVQSLDQIDFSAMSKEDLLAMQKRAAESIVKHEEQNLKDAVAEVFETASKRGIDIAVLLREARAAQSKTKPKRSVAPKYRNPDRVTETWTGSGRTPRWFQEQLDAGRSKEEMLIHS